MSTTSNPNFAEATGNVQFFDYSHSATNSLTAAELNLLVEGGVANAIANASATFISDSSFTSLFSETSGQGQPGTNYYIESDSTTQVIATFDLNANQVFSFDFNAEINLSAKEIETEAEANEANSKISFIVLDISNINQPEVIDYFGIYGDLISGEGIADVDFASSDSVSFTSNQVIDLDGDNGIDSIDANALTGTYERTFNTSTPIAIIKLNTSEIELFGDPQILENESLTGDGSNNILNGGDGNDTLKGLGGNDTLRGGNDHDLLDGGYGFDLLDGGAGNDTVTYDFYDGDVYANLHTGVVTFPGNSNIAETLTGVENIIGAEGDDRLIGNHADNILAGGNGHDTLDGGNGDDTLQGQAGDDFLDGDYGFDLIDGGDGNDTVTYDFYYGSIDANLETGVVAFPNNSTLTDTLVAVENIIGADGSDKITGNSQGNFLDGGEGSDTLSGNDGDDRIYGGYGSDADYLSGDAGNDRLYGESGNDTLVGGTGNDSIRGGWGYDHFVFRRGESFLSGEYDRIVDFDIGIDQIEFHHFSDLTSFNQLMSQADITQSGWNDTLIELETGGKLLIEDVKPYELSASDFKFV